MASDRGGLISRYERFAELGERELELVRTGSYEALAELNDERDALVASLPERAPAEARAALERAAALQAQAEGILSGTVAHARQALVRLDRTRQVASAYAPPASQRRRLDSSG